MQKILNQVPLVAAAYIGIWIITLGYLISLGAKISNLSKQVQALSTVTGKKEDTPK